MKADETLIFRRRQLRNVASFYRRIIVYVPNNVCHEQIIIDKFQCLAIVIIHTVSTAVQRALFILRMYGDSENEIICITYCTLHFQKKKNKLNHIILSWCCNFQKHEYIYLKYKLQIPMFIFILRK